MTMKRKLLFGTLTGIALAIAASWYFKGSHVVAQKEPSLFNRFISLFSPADLPLYVCYGFWKGDGNDFESIRSMDDKLDTHFDIDTILTKEFICQTVNECMFSENFVPLFYDGGYHHIFLYKGIRSFSVHNDVLSVLVSTKIGFKLGIDVYMINCSLSKKKEISRLLVCRMNNTNGYELFSVIRPNGMIELTYIYEIKLGSDEGLINKEKLLSLQKEGLTAADVAFISYKLEKSGELVVAKPLRTARMKVKKSWAPIPRTESSAPKFVFEPLGW